MKKLIINGFPEGERKLVHPSQVLYLSNPQYDGDDSFCIILEEFGLGNAKEFLEYYNDPRDINVYTQKNQAKSFRDLFDKVIDNRPKRKNLFQVARKLVRPDMSIKDKVDLIENNKIEPRILSKILAKQTTSPEIAIKVARADLYPKAEILACIYKHKR